jgi:hypothetical protein
VIATANPSSPRRGATHLGRPPVKPAGLARRADGTSLAACVRMAHQESLHAIGPDGREPLDDEEIGHAHPQDDDDDDATEDREQGVSHRPSRLPGREESEAEIAEDDILDVDPDDDFDGPDA